MRKKKRLAVMGRVGWVGIERDKQRKEDKDIVKLQTHTPQHTQIVSNKASLKCLLANLASIFLIIN